VRGLLLDPETFFVRQERLTRDRRSDICRSPRIGQRVARSAPSARSIAVRASSMSIHADGTTS